ncbi:MAG: LOG family protein [Acidimicrobiia bacterium]
MNNSTTVAVFGSSQTELNTPEWETAEAVGRRLAAAGVAVVTGGYSGTMEAVSKGAASTGGHVIGVTAPALFPKRTGANPFVAEEIKAESLTDRIGTMMHLAAGALALPGSIGTATELLVAWNLNFIHRRHGTDGETPTVAVGPGWRKVVAVLVDTIGATPYDIHVVDEANEAVEWILSQLDIHRTPARPL